MSTAPTKTEVRKSLRASLWDGAAWSLTVGFGEVYFSAFAVFLGAANVFVGLLTTVPQFIGDFCQLAAPRLVQVLRSRKRLVLAGIALQGIALLAMAAAPVFESWRLWFLLLTNILYWVFWMAITPAWQSWMGDLVPEEGRGRYFAKRNRIVQMTTFVALVLGGWLLHRFETFLILIGLGTIGRLLSLFFVGRQTDLPEKPAGGREVSFVEFLQTVHRNNFGRFVLFIAFFGFAVNISGSYFIPYVLEELRFSYLQLMSLFAVLIAFKSLTVPVWGRLSDRYGSLKLLGLASVLFCLTPFLWIASKNYLYLLSIQTVAGVAIGGFELCSFNFLLDGTEPRHRTRFAAYYQVLSGVGIVVGAIVGGLLLKQAPFGAAAAGAAPAAYLAVFLVSGSLRFLLCLVFLPLIREVRRVEPISYPKLLGLLVRFQKVVVE